MSHGWPVGVAHKTKRQKIKKMKDAISHKSFVRAFKRRKRCHPLPTKKKNIRMPIEISYIKKILNRITKLVRVVLGIYGVIATGSSRGSG